MEKSEKRQTGSPDSSRRKRKRKNQKNGLKPAGKKRRKGYKKEALQQKKQRILKQRISAVYKVLENLLFFLFIIGCLYFLFNYRSHFVDGHSMEPTYTEGDRLLIRRSSKVRRYDIITFTPKQTSDATYVKRIVGMPGDKIYLEEDRFYLFTNPAADIEPQELVESGQLPDSTIVLSIGREDVQRSLRSFNEIPENKYFVLGDNREQSTDSRSLGWVDSEQIEGVVDFRYYPFSKAGFVH